MRVALVTFDGFNEIDTFVSLGLINQLRPQGVAQAEIVCPGAQVTSMNGVVVAAQQPLEFTAEADVVLFGGGLHARADAGNAALVDRFALDPTRQLLGAQCAGTLMLARLGLLGDRPACTDAQTRPWVVQAGVRVVDASFLARGQVATAAGSMAAAYLATWVLWRAGGRAAARQALRRVAPLGEQQAWADHALAVVGRSLGEAATD